MDKRTPSSLSAALAGAADTLIAISVATLVLIGLAGPTQAAETSPSGPDERGAARLAPKKQTATQAVVPRNAAPSALDDAYRCHPSEDISCTVVRETLQGTLIVTMRPGGASAPAPAWMVISGAPPVPGYHAGGTVYVVPHTTADAEPMPHQATLLPANGAPILE